MDRQPSTPSTVSSEVFTISGLAITYSFGLTFFGSLPASSHPLSGRIGILDHDQSFRDPNLRRGQTDARRLAHGLDHVVDQRLQILVEVETGRALRRRTGSGRVTIVLSPMNSHLEK